MQSRKEIAPHLQGLTELDLYLPWDIDRRLYRDVTGSLNLSADQVLASRPKVHRLIAEKAPFRPIIKTHAPYSLAGRCIFNTDVTRGATYLVRHPHSIARSLSRMRTAPVSRAVEALLNERTTNRVTEGVVFEPWTSWRTNVESWVGAKDFPVLVVKYEDLRDDPPHWLWRIARHAGIEASRDQVRLLAGELTIEKMAALELTGGIASPVKGEGTFIGSQLEPAPTDTTALQALNAAFATTMARFGYE